MLVISFVLALVFAFTVTRKKNPEVSTSEPMPTILPTIPLSPMPTIPPEVPQIESDLLQIEKDIEKIKKEDRRLFPPSFLFDLDLK